MIIYRKKKRISQNLDLIYEYIDILLKKDISSKDSYRIGIDEFYVLWQNALNEK